MTNPEHREKDRERERDKKEHKENKHERERKSSSSTGSISSSISTASGTSIAPMLPFIFILDIDGTIVGNVKYQVARYSLVEDIRKSSGKRLTEKRDVPISYHPESMLIRPGFQEFLKKVKGAYPQAEFFIYTASEDKWAEKEIAMMEKSLGFKFRRPLFTRKDCVDNGGYKKSVKQILPAIWKSLSKEYSAIAGKSAASESARKMVVDTRLVVIDNMPVFVDCKDRVIMCPTYDYIYAEDITDGIPSDAVTKHGKEAIKYCRRDGVVVPCGVETRDPMISMRNKLRMMQKAFETACEHNREHIHDRFWHVLRKLLVKDGRPRFETLTKDNIVEMERICNKTYRSSTM